VDPAASSATTGASDDGGRGAVVADLIAAVLGRAGRSPAPMRVAALAHGQAAAADDDVPAAAALGEAAALADKVARHAHRVTDEDVADLKAAGWSEGELFDLIVTTALGAALARRSLGLAAVDRWEAR
jgi:alkylhydroperoxidase family enzyme